MAAELDALAERLAAARATGDYFPEWLNGKLTLGDALGVQIRLLDKALASGETLAGWKVGLTSPRARAALGADVRPFGFVLGKYCLSSGATVEAASISRPAIEPELCFTFGSDVSSVDSSVADVRRAVATVSAGYEINEGRRGSVRPDLPAMVSDRLTQWGIVVGEGVPASGVDVNGIRCTLSKNGEQVYSGVSRDELDDHYESLRRLVVELGQQGRGIEAGARVITGAFARFDAAAGERWHAEYDGVGSVEVSFT
jgi:2-keto-4-pentenoate hydratase